MSGFSISQKLGFGLMRLPVLPGGEINLPVLCDLVDTFMASGCNYFDTAYVYHDGKSERAVRKALVERYPRERFLLATKMPHNFLESEADVDKTFEEQLERTGAGYFDFYLMHGVNNKNWERYERFGCWSHGRRMRDAGRVRHLGFSFHGTPDLLERLLDAHPEAEFVQLQINYADWESPRICSRTCYEIVANRGLPVFVMEPVKGGMLANLPEKAAAPLRAFDPNASQASWALRYVAALDGVKVILSGMNTMAQMKDNLRALCHDAPLSDRERAVLKEASEALLSSPTEPCTGCRYCVKGCPANLEIPVLISALNNVRLFREVSTTEAYWRGNTKNGTLPLQCLECGQCEAACPQHLPVAELMKELAGAYPAEER